MRPGRGLKIVKKASFYKKAPLKARSFCAFYNERRFPRCLLRFWPNFPSKIDVFIAIGNNLERFETYKKIEKYNFSYPNLIHPLAFLDPSSQMGNGNYIGQFSNLGAFSKIGDFNIINTYSNIEHEVSIQNFNQLAPGAIICGRSILKNKTFMGANSVIIDKLKIAENTIIGAGAVVLKDIEFPNNTYVGVPARSK